VTESYRVQLDVFSGPLDLLLYLVRRDEIDIQDVQLARLTDQYLEYIKLLEKVDPNTAGDFLVMASTLVELKSRALLPTPPLESEEDEDDPQVMLVRQLLEYKRFKDAARALGSAADDRRKRFVRQPADLPKELEGVELEEAQVWDLLSAFGRVMSAIGQGPGLHQVTYDDTPLAEYAAMILDTLEYGGPTEFQALFADHVNRAEIVGLFLALLELIRKQRVRAEQDRAYGTIYLFLLMEAPEADDPDDTRADEPAPHTISLVRHDPEGSPEFSVETDDAQAQ
jgi:segregation and condensation protein A